MASRVLSTIICSDDYNFGFTLSISNDKRVFVIGSHNEGAHGFKGFVFPPRSIPSLINIVAIAGKESHTLCLDMDGNVFSFGNNYYGQLGIGKTATLVKWTNEPQRIDLPPIRQISAGCNFSICLSESDDLYSFGRNVFGQLGIGNSTACYISPQKIESIQDVDFVECGGSYALCKTLTNEIYAWGLNEDGQLGLGHCISQNAPIKTSWPDNIVDIKCSSFHTVALTLEGEVFSCGDNTLRELGRDAGEKSGDLLQITNIPTIIRIECGYHSSLCFDVDYNMYVFGYNHHGQLGLGHKEITKEPVKNPSVSDIIDVSSGGYHTFVKTSNNEIYAFGLNKFSQLGIKTVHEYQLTPIRVFEDNEDIWFSNINKSKAKSARF